MRLRLAVAAAAALVLAPAAPAAVTLHAYVTPSRVGVGDPFTLTVDASAADAKGTLQVLASPGPFDQVAAPRVTRSGSRVRLVEALVCVDRGCAPDARARRVALPALHASVGGSTVAAAAPVVTVVPRVPAADVSAARAPFRRQWAGPAAEPRLPFGLAAGLALALAVLCAGAGGWLVALELSRRGRAATADPATAGGLRLALLLLRESAGRDAPDRRRAADLASRAARSELGDGPADAATRLAWSPPEPQPPQVEGLADRLEERTRA
ncbi:MAG TPA: hypothetical protein VHC67_04435 [Gaiellaceae bacterium]|nr:hypothetical protein [Gaiellaceae bacterium]